MLAIRKPIPQDRRRRCPASATAEHSVSLPGSFPVLSWIHQFQIRHGDQQSVFGDCHIEKETKKLASTWPRVGPWRNTFFLHLLHETLSTLLIRIWILAFCLGKLPFFLALYLRPNLFIDIGACSTEHCGSSRGNGGIASINCQVTAWKFRYHLVSLLIPSSPYSVFLRLETQGCRFYFSWSSIVLEMPEFKGQKTTCTVY